ncbi:SulA-like leucine-rich domain-containing protein [Paraferrimonas sedimenticola]|uniref:Cell division inhibitor SulA n=1 Tax=Paraferrimonas sedimenticola TaxID=375674 RepID=A0AA37RUT6_9GAMM|nr:SulA-like leucine-rich domain-containing protein [Paraferrimonas sedimenticola]GLP95960.1 cell division inhibitor SulA [Paraferrimonas sedimenticola]
MKKLLGNAPRHPGMWKSNSNSANQGPVVNHVQVKDQGADEFAEIASKLAQLSRAGQWLVMVAPPTWQYKQMLIEAGVAIDKVLLVHPKDDIDALWAIEKALTSGTCSAVVGWVNGLDQRDSRRLQLAAANAQAVAYLMQPEYASGHLPASNAISQVSHSKSNSSQSLH